MSASTTSAANIVGNSKLPIERCRTKPIPELEPTNSPTTAPTTANVIDTFRPANIAGIACGRLTMRNTCRGLASIARARSSMSGSTDLKPCTAETTTGKNPSMKADSTFGSMPKPNQTTKSGAIAIFGIDCENTSSG